MGRAYVLALLVVVSSRVGAERVDALGPCGPIDLVVFRACDAGERAAPAEVAKLGALSRQIHLDDPVDHRSGFVYLVATDSPPASAARYLAYEPHGDLVTTARYRVGMVGA